VPARAQAPSQPDGGDDSMASSFAAAQKAQANGNQAVAEQGYKLFLAEALRRLAVRRGTSGDLSNSIELLKEALELTPNDAVLRLDYAKACRESGDLKAAKAAAENVLTLEPRNAAAHVELGRTLAQMGDPASATQHYETAVAIEPTFENGYALAKEYLRRKDPESASKIFTEMRSSFGDSPELRLKFGSAFGEAGYPERAIPEFEKGLAQNDKLRGGHYALGAAYLLGLGNVMQDKAEAEFRKELANYPDDPLSLFQLGNIEFNRHEFDSAERELSKAAKLDYRNPDSFLLLGQIYSETGRVAEAETALRQCISLTTNVARNHYQVQGAHYLLGRILAQSGRTDEAKQEMKVANELLKENTASMQGLTAPAQGGPNQIAADPEKTREADAFRQKIKGPVADSYNNLGAMAASVGNFAAALRFFQEASKWDPALEGLDYNWGRAAFTAADYKQAVAPLLRALEHNPEDAWVRAALGSSYFSLQDYAAAVKTLQSMERSLETQPQLHYIYAVSQVKSGEIADGVARLEKLQQTNPSVAIIPEALAEAYTRLGDREKADQERKLAQAIRDAAQPSTLQPR
jgi:tetratricopeptide (TPR) repeat protein